MIRGIRLVMGGFCIEARKVVWISKSLVNICFRWRFSTCLSAGIIG